MNHSELQGASGQNLKPQRAPKNGGRMLSLVHGNNERSLHLSPILQQIKDDGPALIDGEVVKDAAAAPKLAKPAANTETKVTPVPPVATQPSLANWQVKTLIGFCAALALGLSAILWFTWQQQQRLANVEYMLEVLVTTPR